MNGDKEGGAGRTVCVVSFYINSYKKSTPRGSLAATEKMKGSRSLR